MGLSTVAKITNGISIAVSFIAVGLLAKVIARWTYLDSLTDTNDKPPAIIGFSLFAASFTSLILIYALVMRSVSSFSAHRNVPLVLECLSVLILLAGSVSMAVQTRGRCVDGGLDLCTPIRAGNAFSFITWIFLFCTTVIDGMDVCRTRAGMPSGGTHNTESHSKSQSIV